MKKKSVTYLLMRGLPASGKTTLAKTAVQEGWKRINKDSLRDMLDGEIFNAYNERKIDSIVSFIAQSFLMDGYNVVSDNMNFDPKHIEEALRVIRNVNTEQETTHCELAFAEVDLPLEVCIQRDSLREKPVTEAVIRKIHNRWFPDGKFPYRVLGEDDE